MLRVTLNISLLKNSIAGRLRRGGVRSSWGHLSRCSFYAVLLDKKYCLTAGHWVYLKPCPAAGNVATVSILGYCLCIMALHVWMRENINCARDRKTKHLVVYTLYSLYNIPRCKNIYLASIHTVMSKTKPKSGSIGYINTLLMENSARWTKRKSCIQNLRKCQSCHLPKHQKQRIKFVRLCSVSSPLNYRLYLKKR